MDSSTFNEAYTFEQELTHLLISVCWLLFINFSCHLFEATPQQGGPSREETLCRLPFPPAPTLFKLLSMSKSWHFENCALMTAAACVRVYLFVQMCVNKWLKVMLNKINSCESEFVYITAQRGRTRDTFIFLIWIVTRSDLWFRNHNPILRSIINTVWA